MGPILDGPASIHHAYLRSPSQSGATSSLTAPVTELATFYFPSSISDSEQKEFDDTAATFNEVVEKHAEGCRGISGGWAVEEVEHASVGKGRAYVLALGWDSVDAHMAFRETKEFKDAIVHVREKIKGAAMYHVKFQEY